VEPGEQLVDLKSCDPDDLAEVVAGREESLVLCVELHEAVPTVAPDDDGASLLGVVPLHAEAAEDHQRCRSMSVLGHPHDHHVGGERVVALPLERPAPTGRSGLQSGPAFAPRIDDGDVEVGEPLDHVVAPGRRLVLGAVAVFERAGQVHGRRRSSFRCGQSVRCPENRRHVPSSSFDGAATQRAAST